MRLSFSVPYWRARRLRIYGFKTDDRRDAGEYAEAVRRAEEAGAKRPRREWAPNFRWTITATLINLGVPALPVAPRGLSIEEAKAWMIEHRGLDPERYVGTILKGHLRFGWSRYRIKWFDFELAVGGEDSMVQVAFMTPLLAAAFGVRVPRRWLKGWVYERRSIISVRPGYIGSLMHVEVWHDEGMANMGRYYRDLAEQGRPSDFVTRAMMRNGWDGYLGGAHFVDRKLIGWPFGQKVYERRQTSAPVTLAFRVPGDDREYEAVLTGEEATWKRPRAWWMSNRWRGYDIRVDHPPMHQGKGEDSWNMDDDGIFGMSSQADSPEGAVWDYVRAVERDRSRYGMPTASQASEGF